MKKFIKKTKLFKKLSAFVLILSLCSTCFTSFPVSAAGNMAFSVGCAYNSNAYNYIDTTQDAISSCDYYALAGYLSRYTANPTVTKINNSYNGVKLMESDIIMLSGHGNYDHLTFNSHGRGGEYYFHISEDESYHNCIKLSNFNMNNVKLIIFSSCSSAYDYGDTNSITETAYLLGADSSLGWNNTIHVECSSPWLNRFNNCIALGYTIQGAIHYANSFNYPDNCTCVKMYTLWGNDTQVLKRTSTASAGTITASEMAIPKISNTAIAKSNLSDKNTIGQIIKNAYSDFWFEDFNIDVVNNDDNNAVITVTEKIGEYSTQNAYVLFYSKGKITEVYDRTIKKLNANEINSVLTANDALNQQQIFSLASQDVSEDYTIKEQSGKLMLDVETGERYYSVSTVIEDASTSLSANTYKHYFN